MQGRCGSWRPNADIDIRGRAVHSTNTAQHQGVARAHHGVCPDRGRIAHVSRGYICVSSDCSIMITRGVVNERPVTDAGVVQSRTWLRHAITVRNERGDSDGRVVASRGVRRECRLADGGIVTTRRI